MREAEEAPAATLSATCLQPEHRALARGPLRTLRGAPSAAAERPAHRDVGFLPPDDDTDLNHFRPQQLQAVRLEQVESAAY